MNRGSFTRYPPPQLKNEGRRTMITFDYEGGDEDSPFQILSPDTTFYPSRSSLPSRSSITDELDELGTSIPDDLTPIPPPTRSSPPLPADSKKLYNNNQEFPSAASLHVSQQNTTTTKASHLYTEDEDDNLESPSSISPTSATSNRNLGQRPHSRHDIEERVRQLYLDDDEDDARGLDEEDADDVHFPNDFHVDDRTNATVEEDEEENGLPEDELDDNDDNDENILDEDSENETIMDDDNDSLLEDEHSQDELNLASNSSMHEYAKVEPFNSSTSSNHRPTVVSSSIPIIGYASPLKHNQSQALNVPPPSSSFDENGEIIDLNRKSDIEEENDNEYNNNDDIVKHRRRHQEKENERKQRQRERERDRFKPPVADIHDDAERKKMTAEPNRSPLRNNRSIHFNNHSNSGSLKGKRKKSHADEIQLSDLKFGEKIGEGAFGEVFKGTLWGMDVAIKTVKIKGLNGESSSVNNAKHLSNLRDFQQEVKIMRNLRHPNIVEFLGCVQSSGALCIVTEYLERGSLEDWLKRRNGKPLDEARAIILAKDIARGLNWLHHKGIIHRDLKSANILIDNSGRGKLCDFGLSHVKKRKISTGFYGIIGTPVYMAPEILQKASYGVQADIFSFGMVVCEMLTGTYPYENMNELQSSRSFEGAIIQGLRPPIPKCSPQLGNLIASCWTQSPDDRPSIDKILDDITVLEKIIAEKASEESTIGSTNENENGLTLSTELDDLPPALRAILQKEQARITSMLAKQQRELKDAEDRLREASVALDHEKRAREEVNRALVETKVILSQHLALSGRSNSSTNSHSIQLDSPLTDDPSSSSSSPQCSPKS